MGEPTADPHPGSGARGGRQRRPGHRSSWVLREGWAEVGARAKGAAYTRAPMLGGPLTRPRPQP